MVTVNNVSCRLEAYSGRQKPCITWELVGYNGAFNTILVELSYRYSNLISINSWGKIIKKENITITIDLDYE